jgi:hypothetical protein
MFICEYHDFQIDEVRDPEIITLYPVTIKYHGVEIENYKTVYDAVLEIRAMPPELRRKMRAIDARKAQVPG